VINVFAAWMRAYRREPCLVHGPAESALKLAREQQLAFFVGLVTVATNGVRAELVRVKGELLLRRAVSDQAEASFREAIHVASMQNARSLELRASTSLPSYGQKIDTVTTALGYPRGRLLAGGEPRDELMEWARLRVAALRDRVSEVIDGIEDREGFAMIYPATFLGAAEMTRISAL